MRAAAVYALTYDISRVADSLFVDTNVWKYLTYAKASLRDPARADQYAKFIGRCRSKSTTLLRSGLSYSELAGIVEKCELDIFNGANGCDIHVKDFRERVVERKAVVEEVEAAWKQVETLSDSLSITVDDATLERARSNFSSFEIDGYDIFFIEQMRAAGIAAIATDDVDFLSIPHLHVFTRNPKSFAIATQHKKMFA